MGGLCVIEIAASLQQALFAPVLRVLSEINAVNS